MKKLMWGAAIAALAFGGSAAPANGAPIRHTVETVTLACPSLTSPAGTAALFVGYGEEGPYFSSEVWRPGEFPEQDKPWYVAWDGEAELHGLTLMVSTTLTDFGTETWTTGQVSATLSPAGPSTTVKERRRSGNTWQVTTTTQTPATVTGRYAIDGVGSFDLSSCVGEILHISTFGTNPAAYVWSYSEAFVGCQMDTGSEDIVVSADAVTRRGRSTADLGVVVFPHVGGEWAAYYGDGAGILTRRSLTGSVTLKTNSEEDPVDVGTASVSAHLARVGVQQTQETEGGTTTTLRFETMRVAGTLRLPDGRVLPLENCSAARVTVKSLERPMRRP